MFVRGTVSDVHSLESMLNSIMTCMTLQPVLSIFFDRTDKTRPWSAEVGGRGRRTAADGEERKPDASGLAEGGKRALIGMESVRGRRGRVIGSKSGDIRKVTVELNKCKH